MENIFNYSSNLILNENHTFKRYFFNEIDFNAKLIGIIGDRGIGKTIFLLQYLKELDLPIEKKLYVNAEYIEFSDINLFELTKEFHKIGGKILVIDEIHKYPNFEKHLKLIYDMFDLKVLFSGSSAIKLEHAKADLSRRALLYRFKGLSFREFLELKTGKKFNFFSLKDILHNHIQIAANILTKIKPFEYFKEYLQYGYYPFYFDSLKSSFYMRLEETINATVEFDLSYIFNIEPKYTIKLKQLIKLICQSKPYELNFSKLAQKIEINRNTLYQYIYYLERGNIFKTLYIKPKGDNIFLKPAKLYLGNTNLNYAYCQNIDTGTIRETFFVQQLDKIHTINYSEQGDFLVDKKYIFEIGGKNKSFKQIKDLPNSYIVADNIEIGFKNKIPLWLFGFLY